MARNKWTVEQIIEEVKLLEREGFDLNSSNVGKHHGALYKASSRLIGGWYSVLESAEIDPEKYRKRHKGKWDKSRIVDEIVKINKSGGDLSHENANKEFKDLYEAGKRIFGGWRQALEQSNIDALEYTKRFYWTKEKLIQEIQNIYSVYGDLSYTFMKDIGYSSIPVTARKLFGSYEEAILESGIDPVEVRRKKGRWSDEEIREEILRIYSESGTLSEAYFRKNHKNIIAVCQSKYGGWFKTLRKFNFSTSEVKTRWTDDSHIISEIIKLTTEGKSLAQSDVPNSLYIKASRFFGSWENALAAASINPSEHRKYNKWSKEEFIQRIVEYRDKGYCMSNASIHQVDSALATSYRLYFDSWHDLLVAADVLDFNFSDMNARKAKMAMGYEFQYLVKEVFEAIGLNFLHEKPHGNFRPDFTLNEHTWIDAKLSSWTALTDNTITKYTKKVSCLIIVYLRGNDIKGYDGVEFIPIEDFFPHLLNLGRQDIIQKSKELKTQLNLLEQVA